MNKSTKKLVYLLGLQVITGLFLILAITYQNKIMMVTSLVILIGTLTYLALVLVQNYRDNQIVDRLTQSVKNINAHEAAQPVLIKPGEKYKELADAINNLSDTKNEQLRESGLVDNEVLKTVNALPVGVMLIDQSSNVIFANPQMANILDRKIASDAHPYTMDVINYKLLTMIDHVFDTHRSTRAEITETTNGNKTLDVQVVFSQNNSSFHLIVIAYDISEVINITQMQVDFLRNASHELKTPVTAISGFAKTLLDGAKDDPEVLTEFLEIINRQSDQLTSLINDILTISHIQKDEVKLTDSVVLRDFVNQEIETQSNQIKQHRLQVHNLIDEHIEVNIDAESLQRIVRNLISNAVKYNRDDGEIMINASIQGNFWYFSVQDTGIGIAKSDLSRIFERFYRSDESRNKQQISGTGLGLSIVNELVQSLSGKITVDSQRGVGSTFTVRLPRK
ncbi:sensor histidine kinase [Lentilactobacillus sp. SPB1-3]|uniref:Sensor histidine kinase n=1 Tax=Lentilactobacillus terminaliae TaxID=3003483 RepID=A0ACD5DGT1_9LACO|nr:ATP-binding protein [Lentilactobacillus sp. SPB1-3]MCZ0976943.1 ATP-binding protein [Lentilactobacillus sp. SPB1-3]